MAIIRNINGGGYKSKVKPLDLLRVNLTSLPCSGKEIYTSEIPLANASLNVTHWEGIITTLCCGSTNFLIIPPRNYVPDFAYNDLRVVLYIKVPWLRGLKTAEVN